MQKIIVFIFLILPLTLLSQINKFGAPFITNFSEKTYNASEKTLKANNLNWTSIKSSNGLMFFGNAETGIILIYDNNKKWQRLRNNNNSDIRSFATDTSGLVYVGAIGEFGYIGPDKSGKLNYHNLSKQIDTTYHFSELNIWKIFDTKDEVIFYSVKYLFRYQKSTLTFKVTPLPKNSFLGFMVNNNLYIGNYDKGLLKLSGDSITRIQGGNYFINKDIFGMLPWTKEEVFINVTGEGFYIFNTLSGKVRPFADTPKQKESNEFFKTIQVYFTTLIYDNVIGIATIGNGAYFMTRDGKIFAQYDNTQTHLIPDNIVTSIYAEQEGNYKVLWLTTNKGISKIEFDLPIFNFYNQFGLTDIPVNIASFNDKIYISTFSGLFRLSYDNNYPKIFPVPNMENKTIYSISAINHKDFNKLVIGTTNGLYELGNNGKVKFINNTENIITNQILYSKKFQHSLFIGSERGLKKFDYNNDHWSIDTTFFPGIQSNIAWLKFDNTNHLWAATLNNGLIKMDLETKETKFYDTKLGLPSISSLRVYFLNNKIFVSGDNGIYEYDESLDYFKPSIYFGNHFTDKKVKHIYQIDNKDFLIESNNRISKVIINHDDSITYDNKIFMRLPEMSLKEILVDQDKRIWLTTSEGVFTILPVSNTIHEYYPDIKIPVKPYKVYLFSVNNTKIDSTVFFGNFPKLYISGKDTLYHTTNSQSDLLNITLPYKNNDVSFRFTGPYYINETNLLYSFYLEGYDLKWSKWSDETKAVYTNLKEGKYTFSVKAKNTFDIESQVTSFYFEILPPWYRTIWAYIVYSLIFISGMYFIVKFYTRKLERDKKRLEKLVQERTAEVVKQKDEIEAQKATIEEKNKDITDSIRYAEQIQVAVLPTPVEDLSKHLEFFIYFQPKDIVSGDFYFTKFISRANLFVAAAVDCTGHGVPGAFMSLLGVTFLNEIINKTDITHTDQVLNNLRENVIKALNQEGKEEQKKDGMDMALIAFNTEKKTIEFSGANNPLYLFRENSKPPLNSEKKFEEDENVTMYEFKADRMPIGLHDRSNIPFVKQDIKGEPGDMMYIFSDGFADQFGGEKGKKYTYKRFKRFLLSIHKKSMEEQEQLLRQEMIDWRNQTGEEEEQIDDHIIIGVRLF